MSCKHYYYHPMSGPRNEPPDTPAEEGCDLEHSPNSSICYHCVDVGTEPISHGCDDSCPDYEAGLEPDWDSQKGGADYVD